MYNSLYHLVVAAFLLWVVEAPRAGAQEAAETLSEQLRNAAAPEVAAQLAKELELEWSRSGSVAMNMLLQRGREALEEKDYRLAVEHLTALTDHAPEFATGWHARARAFFALNLYGPALDDLSTALHLNPAHYPSLFGLGAMFMEMGDLSRAQEAFQYALDLHPHFKEAQDALKQLEARGVGRSL